MRPLLAFLRQPVLGFPFWLLLAAAVFVWLVDWLSGGRLQH